FPSSSPRERLLTQTGAPRTWTTSQRMSSVRMLSVRLSPSLRTSCLCLSRTSWHDSALSAGMRNSGTRSSVRPRLVKLCLRLVSERTPNGYLECDLRPYPAASHHRGCHGVGYGRRNRPVALHSDLRDLQPPVERRRPLMGGVVHHFWAAEDHRAQRHDR